MLKLSSSPTQIAKASSSNATATRRLVRSSTAKLVATAPNVLPKARPAITILALRSCGTVEFVLRRPSGETPTMMTAHCSRTITPPESAFVGFRFPPDVIVLAVRWYLRFSHSYRDLEELLAERGIEVDHMTVYRWVLRFTPLLTEAAQPSRHAVGTRWQVDETYVRAAGATSIGRSTSSVRSSTYSSLRGATATPRAGSSSGRSARRR
jgi:hypothetical protein